MTHRPALLLRRALLAGWAAWLTLVWTTNLFDAAKAAGLLDERWAFASGNYAFLCKVTARHATPAWLNGVLFAGVLCWEGLAALLFWLAWLRYRGSGTGMRTLHAAFTAGLGLWLGFLIADEVFIAYDVEKSHLALFVAQAATLLIVERAPEERREE